jgi:hypothetical protein
MNSDSTDLPPLTEPPVPSALPVRLANVYAAPGEVFDALRGQPSSVANWLVPAILAALVGIVSVWVMFSQPAIRQQIEDLQSKRYEQLVADGKMTQEQVDQLQRQMGELQFTIEQIAGMIGVLGGLVTTLLMVITGSMFTHLSPILFISNFDAANKLHLLASSMNLFTFWWLGVVALGLARVGQVSFGKVAFALFGLWAALRLAIVFSGLGASGM